MVDYSSVPAVGGHVGRARLFNDLVRPPQHRLRDRQAERLRGLQVDHELKLGGLLDGQVAEECLFPEVESLATRMKGLALYVEDLFSSFFVTCCNEPFQRRPGVARELPKV
jgi:hypothetical protein